MTLRTVIALPEHKIGSIVRFDDQSIWVVESILMKVESIDQDGNAILSYRCFLKQIHEGTDLEIN